MTRTIHTYHRYNFINKDPIVDEIRTKMQDEGVKFKEIEANGGPVAATIHNWIYGETRKPQNASIEACLRAMGLKRVIVKQSKDDDFEKTLKNVKALPHKKGTRTIFS